MTCIECIRQRIAIYIKGPVEDLGDIVRIAASKGKQDLKSENVIVKPVLYNCEDGYVVVVESQKDSGCRKASFVEAGKRKN